MSDLSILEQLEAEQERHRQLAADCRSMAKEALDRADGHQRAARESEKVIAAMKKLNSVAPATVALVQTETRRPTTSRRHQGNGKRSKATRAAKDVGVIDARRAKGRELWDAGKSVREIAEALDVSTVSVRNHKQSDGWPERSE